MLNKLLVILVNHLGPNELESFIYSAVSRQANKLPDDKALRLLFNLDAKFYALQGKTAVSYGNGIHPKIRVTNYHDFLSNVFIQMNPFWI